MKIDKLYLLAGLLGLFLGSVGHAIAQTPGTLFDVHVDEINAAHPNEICVKFRALDGTLVPPTGCNFRCITLDLNLALSRWALGAMTARQMAGQTVAQVDYFADAASKCHATRVVTEEPAQ